METIKTQFVHDERLNCYSLYVNGVKTNTYYFDKPMIHYDHLEAKARAYKIKRAIERGILYPENGNWEMFDICGHITVNPAANDFIELQQPPKNTRAIEHGSINSPSFAEIVKRYTAQPLWTQWVNIFDEATETIKTKYGIHIANYGYSIYSI